MNKKPKATGKDKSIAKNLKINKETIQSLTDEELGAIGGGVGGRVGGGARTRGSGSPALICCPSPQNPGVVGK